MIRFAFALLLLAGAANAQLALDCGGGACGHANQSASATTSVTLSTTNSNTVIIMFVQYNNTTCTQTSSVSGGGLTWTKRSQHGCIPNWDVEEWYAVAASPLSSATLSYTGWDGARFTTVDAFGISGADTTTVFDPNVSLPANSSNYSCNTFSTTNANNFLIAMTRGGSSTQSSNGYFTTINGADWQFSGYNIVSSVQSSVSPQITAETNGVKSICDAVTLAPAPASTSFFRPMGPGH